MDAVWTFVLKEGNEKMELKRKKKNPPPPRSSDKSKIEITMGELISRQRPYKSAIMFSIDFFYIATCMHHTYYICIHMYCICVCMCVRIKFVRVRITDVRRKYLVVQMKQSRRYHIIQLLRSTNYEIFF